MGVKPVSGTALDTGHALYTSLLAAWGFLEGSGNSIDSKGSNNLTLSGGAWGTDGAGDACYSVSTAAASPCALTSTINLAGTSSWSVAWRAQKNANDIQGMVYGNNDTAQFYWQDGGANIQVRSGGDIFFGVSSFTAMDDWVQTFNPAGSHTMRVYQNGVEVSGSPNGSANANQALLFQALMGGYNGTSTFGFEGKLSYFYVWDGRELSSTEAATLHTTPYVVYQAAAPPNVIADRPHGSQRPFPFLPSSPRPR